jgi:hypothetical protein
MYKQPTPLEHGTDVEWIHKKLMYLSVMLLVSSSSFLVALAIILFKSNFTPFLRMSNVSIMVFWIMILFVQDTGTFIRNFSELRN